MRLYLLLIAISLGLASCSSPTKVAEKAIEGIVNEQSLGYYKLQNFQKIDGAKRNENGIEGYSVSYVLDIECIKSDGYRLQEYVGHSPIEVTNDKFFYPDPSDHIVGYKNTLKTVAGTKFKVVMNFGLVKHDQGWIIDFWNCTEHTQ